MATTKRPPRRYVFKPEIIPLDIREQIFTQKIMALAKGMEWKVAHFTHTMKLVRIGTKPDGSPDHMPMADKGAKGWPDIVLAKHGRVLFRELKTEARSSVLEPEQAEWLAELQDAGLDAKVWRPRDWDEIQFQLAGYIAQPLMR